MSEVQSLPEQIPEIGQTSTEPPGSPQWMAAVGGKLKAATRLLGIESVRRSNKTVDDAHEAHTKANLGIYGDGASEAGSGDMGDSPMVLGDMTTNIHNHHQKKGMGKIAKAAVAAGLLASGVGAGAAMPLVLDLLKDKGGDIISTPETGESIGIIELGTPDR